MKHAAALLTGVLVVAVLSAPAATAATGAAPTARNDRLVTFEDTGITYTAPGVLSNDTDPEGRRLTARMVRKPRHGTARLSSTGRLVYTPDRNWSGRDRLVYVARDASGRRDRATVVLVVKAVNDAPRLSMDIETPVREYSPGRVTLTARDPEGDAITYEFDCNGDGTYEVSQPQRRHDCEFGDQGVTTVRGRAVDAHGARSTAQLAVKVTNQKPVVTLPDDGSAGHVDEEIVVGLGSFADPGLDDGPWTATVDWGDGSPVEAIGSFAGPGDLGTLTHAWTMPALYEVTVYVAEAGGATGSSFTFASVID
ncbi:hypothetical protein GCM10009623_19410 [Nocardioides aestuarii]|uniref:Ig-like domain-containing protein n=1 Tax=Nocardioides aestuarii TaxID=252231 RepID=A0ABW4TNN5_9ACTN